MIECSFFLTNCCYTFSNANGIEKPDNLSTKISNFLLFKEAVFKTRIRGMRTQIRRMRTRIRRMQGTWRTRQIWRIQRIPRTRRIQQIQQIRRI